MADEFSFEALLQQHNHIKQLASIPTRILRIEGMDDEIFTERVLYKLFGKFGDVTYVNVNPLKDGITYVHFATAKVCNIAKENLLSKCSEEQKKSLDGKIKVSFERPLHKAVIENGSRHLWLGSIDDTAITSDILARIFGSFGVITDRPHIYHGENQGFVDFSTIYEAVDAMMHLNGCILGSMAIVIRFGRQEFGKILWAGLADKNSGTLDVQKVRQKFEEFGEIAEVQSVDRGTACKLKVVREEDGQRAIDALQMEQALIDDVKVLVDYWRGKGGAVWEKRKSNKHREREWMEREKETDRLQRERELHSQSLQDPSNILITDNQSNNNDNQCEQKKEKIKTKMKTESKKAVNIYSKVNHTTCKVTTSAAQKSCAPR
eukprot:TRINITY_DN4676_c0_g1_i1.p1 TRINITY_DN4676_c0_g1~~TRINITY_DN4676_c0_g1_i1.p1  ORF type:complete len:377 (-),score=59.65 TRINITY_DN4676_c0_g1_i1:2380-3510(-)